MKVRLVISSFEVTDFDGNKCELHAKNVVIVCPAPHPEKEIEIEGKPEYQTKEGQPVLALGYDNFEIIEKDNSRTQVVKVNE